MKNSFLENQQIDELTSKCITSLRYILIVLVVFIHCKYRNSNIAMQSFSFSKLVQDFISNGIASASVPLFLLFSSYLQFKKNDKYLVLLRKKTKSILIPFFLWPILNIFLYALTEFVISKLKICPMEIPQTNWGIFDWLEAFFGFSKEKPYYANLYVIQFWFLENLFILILISPVLKFFIDKFPLCYLIFVSLISSIVPKISFFNMPSLFYYSIGIYWAKYNFDLFRFVGKIKWKALIPLFIFIFFLCIEKNNTNLFSFLVLTDSILLLKLSLYIANNKKFFTIAKYLSNFSFWLFAIHMPFLLRTIQKFICRSHGNSLLCLAEYFLTAFLTVATGTLIGIFLRKFFPKLFCILNGGRA